MRVIIAPDKFKGALTAAEVARAIATGIAAARPDTDIRECPLADGGEGTLDVLQSAWGGSRRVVHTSDPIGRPIDAPVGLAHDGTTAIIELAAIAGYAVLDESERRALRTTTFGVGRAIRAALESGVDRIVIGLGGSATVDGGAGLMQALGLKLIGADGYPLPDGATGADLLAITRLEWFDPPEELATTPITIACDVLNPACGDNGAARVFAPQKGADAAAVETLERGIAHWATMLEDLTGKPLRHEPGTGAAGAAALPLLAFCHAEVLPGVDVVFEAVKLADRIADADLVITGEGRLDRQSFMGKVVGALARLCRTTDTPCVAVVGTVADAAGPWSQSIDRVFQLDCPLEQTRDRLIETARRLATDCL